MAIQAIKRLMQSILHLITLMNGVKPYKNDLKNKQKRKSFSVMFFHVSQTEPITYPIPHTYKTNTIVIMQVTTKQS